MKQILPILLITLLMSCTSSKKKDPFEEKPKGKVSKISQYMYEASEKFGEISKGRLVHYDIENFDEKGNIQKATYISMFNSTKADTTEVIRKYNGKGEWIALIDLKTGLSKTNFIYDNGGHRIEENDFEGKKLTSKTKYRFEDGDLEDGEKYNGDGNIEKTTKYKLNSAGMIIETEEFTKDGKSAGRYVYSYNNEGLMDKTTSYKGEKVESVYSVKYVTYDKDKNWIIAHHFYKDEPAYIYKRKIEYR